MANIEILLATYNGGPFVERQIASLFEQTHQGFNVIVSDDGSSDETMTVINRMREQYPDRIRLLPSEKSGSAKANFMRLLRASSAPYVMFCDQDDDWLPHKVARTYERMRAVEGGETRTPVLVHTDLCVTGKATEDRRGSFFAYQALNPRRDRFHQLLMQNNVTGCTVMINAATRALALRAAPTDMVMHDHWLALIAAAFGRISFIDEQTLFYRQHGGNSVGAKPFDLRHILGKAISFWNRDDLQRDLSRIFKQADFFAKTYGSELSDDQREVAGALANLSELGFFQRKASILRYRAFKHGIIRNIGLLMRA